MDILAVTNFPDIRLKSIIRSSEDGNLLIIPREGGYMVRLYIELDALQFASSNQSEEIKVEDLIQAAKPKFCQNCLKRRLATRYFGNRTSLFTLSLHTVDGQH